MSMYCMYNTILILGFSLTFSIAIHQQLGNNYHAQEARLDRQWCEADLNYIVTFKYVISYININKSKPMFKLEASHFLLSN